MAKADMDGIKTMDRISELPEPIIHHIISFLRCPKDVVRTGVLSKKWRTICASFFTFDFDQRKFHALGREQKEKFKSFVENSLATKLEPMISVQKFRLYVTSFDSKFAFHMNQWISAATSKNVKELEIHVQEKKRRGYTLPWNVLTSKTITSLKLCGCKLDNYGVLELPHLKELSIKEVYLEADVIQSFIHSCPAIEDLRLIHCSGLGCLHISTLLKLNRVELHECHGLKQVEIGIENLNSFWYFGKKSWECKINLAGCRNLRYLTLKDSNLTDELFQDQISKFPILEKLVLKECGILERITILGEKLKELSIIKCKKLEEANIDAPKLFFLEYTGNRLPFSSMNITGLREAKFHFQSLRKDNSLILRELQKFMGKFDKNEAWKLVVNSNKNVTIHEEMEEIQFPSPSSLKLVLTKSSTNLKDLVDCLLRMSHPKTLSLISSSHSEFLKFLTEKIMHREENPNCCRYYSRKCWLHYLKDAGIENLEGAKSEEISASNSCSKSSQTRHQTTFKLNWRSG